MEGNQLISIYTEKIRAPVRLNRRTKIFPLLVLKNQFQFAIAAHIDNVPKQAKKKEMIYLLIIIIEYCNLVFIVRIDGKRIIQVLRWLRFDFRFHFR